MRSAARTFFDRFSFQLWNLSFRQFITKYSHSTTIERVAQFPLTKGLRPERMFGPQAVVKFPQIALL